MPCVRYIGPGFDKERLGLTSPGPARYAHQRSVGKAVLSTEKNLPVHTFSNAPREEPKRGLEAELAEHAPHGDGPGPAYFPQAPPNEAQGHSFGTSPRTVLARFISAEHSHVELIGRNSPGPVYEQRSTLGAQQLSDMGTAPAAGFTGGSRFEGAAPYISRLHLEAAKGVEGPGPKYAPPSSFGALPDIQASPRYGFGTSERAGSESARYLSEAHAQRAFKGQGPAPAYDVSEAAGRGAPGYSFGSGERGAAVYISRQHAAAERTGLAGSSKHIAPPSGLGKQAESPRKSAPAFSFGSGARFGGQQFISALHSTVERTGHYSPGPKYGRPGEVVRATHPAPPSFGTSPRFRRGLYLGPLHTKSEGSLDSPGPKYDAVAAAKALEPQGGRFTFGVRDTAVKAAA